MTSLRFGDYLNSIPLPAMLATVPPEPGAQVLTYWIAAAFGAVLTYHVKEALPDGAQLVLTIADATGKQVRRLELDKTPDFYESVYERLSESCFDILSEPLVRLSRDFEIIPGAAPEPPPTAKLPFGQTRATAK